MTFFIAFALALTPIYWTPWIGIEYVVLFKYSVLALLVAIPLCTKTGSVISRFCRNPAILLAGLVAISVQTLFLNPHDTPMQVGHAAKFLVVPVILLASLGSLVKDFDHLIRIGILSARMMIVVVISGYALLLLGMDVSPSGEFNIKGGFFGVVRTGWSNSISCFTILYFSISSMKGVPRHSRMICRVASLLCFSTQLFVVGRAGILCSLLGFALCATIAGKKRHVAYIVGAGLVIAAISSDWAKRTLRITRDNIFEPSINDISGGRVELYTAAFDVLSSRIANPGAPYVPYEHYNSRYGNLLEIHNVFLNAALEYGVLYACITFGITVGFCMRAFHLSDVRAKLVFVPVIASPFVIMFLEPNSIWRAPTAYVLWWMLVSMLAKVAGRGKSTEEGPRLDYGTPTQLGQTEPLDSTGSEKSRGRIKVLSALQLFGHPRDSKRIAMLQQAGFEVEAVAFERGKHDARLPDCPVERLATIPHGRYIQRILPQLLALPAIRRAIRRNHIVYASGPDMALSALVAGWGLRRPVILEVGDIRGAQVSKGLVGFVVRLVDRYTLNGCKLLVVTAQGFVDEYYRKWVKTQTPAMIMENKQEEPEPNLDAIQPFAPPDGKPLVDRPLRIGYFGVLRCEWSWRVLEALAVARPDDVEIVAAGYVLNSLDIPERAKKLSNVEFIGEFRSPDDLPRMYGDVDLIWGCYPYPRAEEWNWRWARTNRFYESCLYQKPIIALRDSGDAGEVERHDLGPIVNGPSIEGVVDALSKITPSDLTRWEENLAKLPRDLYVYTNEGEELAAKLKGLVDTDAFQL